MNLVHIIPKLDPGGPTRSLTTFVEWSTRNIPRLSHLILTPEPRGYPLLTLRLRRCGAIIHHNPKGAQIDETLMRADVVLIHFWNTPILWSLIARRLPPVRSVIWANVRGDRLPQRLNANLLHSATGVALTADAPIYRLILGQRPSYPAWCNLTGSRACYGAIMKGFEIDYIGTVNSGKLDPRVFSIMSNLAIPGVRVRIFGGALEAAMAKAHAAMPDPSRVEICGFTENIAEVFATTDVFAFPMAEGSYGSSDIALQEAMLAGLPVVIYADRGPSRFVSNEKTGLVVSNAEEFAAALERLYHEPTLDARSARAPRRMPRPNSAHTNMRRG